MSNASAPTVVTYEQPLNERVRTFLRLEFLFNQHRHHQAGRNLWDVRATLHALIDILSVVSRSDIKSEIIKELSDQHAALSRLSTAPGVDPARLESVLSELNAAINALQSLSTQFISSALRDNEFLISVLHRSTIPGGTCAFDLPGYHHWLAQPPEIIRRDLDAWFADLKPYDTAIALLLRMLRNSTSPIALVAQSGVHLYTPSVSYALLRVMVSREFAAYPEISAGRHRFTVRFMNLRDINVRSQQATQDISFQLQCCVI